MAINVIFSVPIAKMGNPKHNWQTAANNKIQKKIAPNSIQYCIYPLKLNDLPQNNNKHNTRDNKNILNVPGQPNRPVTTRYWNKM